MLYVQLTGVDLSSASVYMSRHNHGSGGSFSSSSSSGSSRNSNFTPPAGPDFPDVEALNFMQQVKEELRDNPAVLQELAIILADNIRGVISITAVKDRASLLFTDYPHLNARFMQLIPTGLR